jgi:hypothetical protein
VRSISEADISRPFTRKPGLLSVSLMGVFFGVPSAATQVDLGLRPPPVTCLLLEMAGTEPPRC